MLANLLVGATFAFAAAVQPGPFQTYLIAQTLHAGWRRALPAAFAPLLSDGPVILLVLVVLTRLPPAFVPALQLAGGLFLLYLAAGALKTWRRHTVIEASESPSPRQSLLKATLINLLNPNPYLSWSLVLGPLLLKGWRETPSHGIALLAGFYGTFVILLLGLITLVAGAGQLGPRVSRLLIGLSAIALAGFGCYELWSGARALV
ncbi:MAG TPA: LysE family transporter [Thermoanaerobaculia bacterium]|nr:LysE family transporter [Thermoanaerobaculia bacterium]